MLNFLIAGVQGDAQGLDTFQTYLSELVNKSIKYIVGISVTLCVLWAIYIGVKVLSAKKAEQRIEAKTLLKQFILGIVLIFVLAVGAPLLIQTLVAWAGDKGLGLITAINLM